MELTTERANELLAYDPATGELYWKVDRAWNAREGEIAGSVSKNLGYVFIYIDRENYLAHRVIWLMVTGDWPEQIDHVNHVRADNSWINLRETTQEENTKNQKRRLTNISGCTGVYFDKSRGKWSARISDNKSQIFLGRFNTLEDAIAARKSAEIVYGYHENHGGS